MIILNNKKWSGEINDFYHISIPRTASNSLSRFMGGRDYPRFKSARFNGSKWEPLNDEPSPTLNGSIKGCGHSPLEAALRRDKIDLSKVLIFASIRNPWDRIVSLMEFTKQNLTNTDTYTNTYRGNCEKWTAEEDKKKMLQGFISSYKTIKSGREDFFLGKLTHIQTLKNQVDWLTVNKEIKADFVLEFERLQKDVDKLMTRMGLPPADLPTNTGTNSNNRLPVKEYYDKENVELVGEIYKRDIDAFNFAPDFKIE
jgi:hypothetical protein